jgi:N-methylhydantoinase A
MTLDAAAAEAACARLGETLGLDAEQTAWGIRAIALADMVKAVKARLVERGLDPAELAFISYGGCGGLFTADIAAAIGANSVIFPEFASVFSAFGAAASDIRRERVKALGLPAAEAGPLLKQAADELAGLLEGDLAADGVEPEDRLIQFEADMRFRRQRWELPIALSADELRTGSLGKAMERFLAEYSKRYGKGALMAGMEVELTLLRAVGIGRTVKATLNSASGGSASGVAQAGHGRPVRLTRDGERAEVQVIDPASLSFGSTITGPALVDSSDTTIWIPPGATARVDAALSLVLEFTR